MLRDLLIDNPMLVEVRRFFRRMFSTRVSGGANVAALVMIVLFYLLIVFVIGKNAAEIDPVGIILFQTGLFAVLLPVMVSGAIAGERERRTWEILLVAPVTKAQIVAGKFVASVAGLLAFILSCLVPALLCVIRFEHRHALNFLLSELLSLCFGILLISLTLYTSSRSRTTFAALGVSMGIVFTSLAAVPIFIQVLPDREGEKILRHVYPFTVIYGLGDFDTQIENATHWMTALLNSGAYLVCAGILLSLTVSSVRKMEEIQNAMTETKPKRGRARA